MNYIWSCTCTPFCCVNTFLFFLFISNLKSVMVVVVFNVATDSVRLHRLYWNHCLNMCQHEALSCHCRILFCASSGSQQSSTIEFSVVVDPGLLRFSVIHDLGPPRFWLVLSSNFWIVINCRPSPQAWTAKSSPRHDPVLCPLVWSLSLWQHLAKFYFLAQSKVPNVIFVWIDFSISNCGWGLFRVMLKKTVIENQNSQ